MAAVPLFPSLVAVIVAEPAARPVTSPLVLTLATDALLLDHVTTRPVRGLPAESLVTAESCWVPPTGMLADAGLSVSVATGTFETVIAAVPLAPSLVAVIVAEPTPPPVTSPLRFTAATVGALLDHVTGRPAKGLPLESRATALSCTLAPTSMLTTAGDRVTDATGGTVTVTLLVSAIPVSGGSVAMTT
jgi:hypothetical protein